MSAPINVELVFAAPERQRLSAVQVPEGATVGDVIAAGRLQAEFPDQVLGELQTGIWGRPVGRDEPVRDGDRVEVYRPLRMDPREARRLKVGR